MLLAVFGCSFGGLPLAEASFTYWAVVAIPVESDAGFHEIVHVTYLHSTTGALPGYEVGLTCSPGFVTRRGVARYGKPAGDSLVQENWNAANIAGLWVEVDPRVEDHSTWIRVDPTTPGQYVIDTLRVTLYTDSAYARAPREHEVSWAYITEITRGPTQLPPERRERLRRESLETKLGFVDQLVDATIVCILDNAARSRPRIRHVELTVAGSERVADRSGTFVPRRADPPIFR